ncbi:MAG: hypothetical protein LBD73_02675 [Deferribacteraceae bacterium]|jgi:hypothetical protein|nr:hypothetical protein [Deferribacteraceae bacterium]
MIVSGIAGDLYNNSSISNSYSTADVNGSPASIGSIAGGVRHSSIISKGYAVGNVSGDFDNTGGIARFVQNGTKIINNAAINTSVAGSLDVNRIVGEVQAQTIRQKTILL